MPAMTDRGTSADTMVFMASLQRLGLLCCRADAAGLVDAGLVALLVEGLGVERAGRGRREAGEDEQGDEGGYDGLHDHSPAFLVWSTCSVQSSVASLVTLR